MKNSIYQRKEKFTLGSDDRTKDENFTEEKDQLEGESSDRKENLKDFFERIPLISFSTDFFVLLKISFFRNINISTTPRNSI